MMKYCNSCGVRLAVGTNWTEARKRHHMNNCNSCNSLKSKEWKEKNKEKAAESNKHSKIKYFYGLSKEGYALLYQDSFGKCNICGVLEGTHKKSLHVDHDHKTGRIRGLLCSNCNTALGKFKDSLELLEKAKEYLHRSKNED